MFAALLLSFVMVAAPASADSFWQDIHWTTADGVKMAGVYHASTRPGAYTWVMLHGLGSGKGEWDAFARKLAGQGNGVFLYDARGHGQSRQTSAGLPLSYQEWRTAGRGTPWDAMPSDLGAAVTRLHEMKGVPEKKIAVGGASLGANVALVYASRHAQVPALALLSPGLMYAGIESASAYQTYRGRPVFIAASSGDAYAYASVQELTSAASSPLQVVVEGNNGHGVQMFKGDKFSQKLLEWMKGLDGNRNRRPS